MDNSFERAIKGFLDDKLYERRGISKEEYVERCRAVWDQTPCQDGSYKIILDGLYDYAKTRSEIDYTDNLLLNHLATKPRNDAIECHCLVKTKWQDGDLKIVPWDEPSSADLDDPAEPAERPYLFALFDVLGFEHLHNERGTASLYELYRDVIARVTAKDSFSTMMTENSPEVAMTLIGDTPLRHQYFSDTIILWTPLLPEFISPFCARCADVVCESILMGLPLRGAITSGSAILNRNKGVFLGTPIIEAARVEAQQNWIGVSFGPSCTEPTVQLALHPDLLQQHYTQHFKTTDKFNKWMSLMTLDWPRRARDKDCEAAILDQLLHLKSRAPRDKQYYYDNTISFLEHSRRTHDWHKHSTLIVPEPLKTMITVTLADGQELEGMRPHFAAKDSALQNAYFLLVPADAVEAVRNLALDAPLTINALAKLLYVIPRKALVRIQLLRQKSGTKSKKHDSEGDDSTSGCPSSPQTPRDLTAINDAMAKIFIGVRGFDIFIPTLHTVHECARTLVFVTLAIPEGEVWQRNGIEILDKMELIAHRDFITALQTFCSQSTLPKEASEYFATMTRDYKDICGTFIGETEEFLAHVDPEYKTTYAPEIMKRERFHLLGLMLKMLCVLTQENGAIKL
jgi:hypothetical protein